jgi:hypothetical protein
MQPWSPKPGVLRRSFATSFLRNFFGSREFSRSCGIHDGGRIQLATMGYPAGTQHFTGVADGTPDFRMKAGRKAFCRDLCRADRSQDVKPCIAFDGANVALAVQQQIPLQQLNCLLIKHQPTLILTMRPTHKNKSENASSR